MTDDLRIYVACLASYNNGRLYGKWIDAEQDADAINEEIRLLLKGSPYPNVVRADYTCTDCGHTWTQDNSPYRTEPTKCAECDSTEHTHGEPYPSAEEYAIHDHEGFDGLIGEYTGIDEVVQIAEALSEHGDKYAGLRKDGRDHDEAIKMIEDNYQGEYGSLEDWAEQFLDDTGAFSGLDKNSPLKNYFDYERYAKDAEMGGDIMTVEGEGRKIHVFWNH